MKKLVVTLTLAFSLLNSAYVQAANKKESSCSFSLGQVLLGAVALTYVGWWIAMPFINQSRDKSFTKAKVRYENTVHDANLYQFAEANGDSFGGRGRIIRVFEKVFRTRDFAFWKRLLAPELRDSYGEDRFNEFAKVVAQDDIRIWVQQADTEKDDEFPDNIYQERVRYHVFRQVGEQRQVVATIDVDFGCLREYRLEPTLFFIAPMPLSGPTYRQTQLQVVDTQILNP